MSFILFILLLIILLPFMLFGTSVFRFMHTVRRMTSEFKSQQQSQQQHQPQPKKRSFKGPFKNNKGDYVEFEEIVDDDDSNKKK